MSETTPTPDPGNGGPSDPTAPEPTTWTPPDPLAAPQPWAPPAPWTPTPWTPSPWAPPGSAPPGPWPQHGSATPGAPGTPPPPGPGTDPAAAPGPTGWTSPGAPPGPAGWAAPGAAPHSAQSVPGGTPRPATPPGYPAGPPAPPWPGGAPGPGWPPAGYPPPYAYPASAPRRSTGGWVVAVVVTVVVALVLAFCGCVGLGVLGSFVDDSATSGQPYDPEFDEPDGGLAGDPTEGAPPIPATTPSGGRGRFTVVYEATGAGTVDVQFYDANADFLQVDGVRSPWRLAFTANDRERVQIIASPTDSGEASCRITIDGKVVSQDSGEYGATCFGW